MSSRTIKLPLKPRETTRCWRLDGPDLPPITRTVTVAEAARAMLMRSFAQMFGQDRLPDGLHGPAHPMTLRIPTPIGCRKTAMAMAGLII